MAVAEELVDWVGRGVIIAEIDYNIGFIIVICTISSCRPEYDLYS